MAALAGFWRVFDVVGIVARSTGDTRVLSIQGVTRLAVVEILHPVYAIVAAKTVAAESLDVRLAGCTIVLSVADETSLVIDHRKISAGMAFGALHRNGRVIHLV